MNSIYKRHNYWIKLAKMFGEVDFPEDAVQDCYIKLYDYENVSDAFFSTALHHMIMDNHRKKKLDLTPIIDSIDKEEVEVPCTTVPVWCLLSSKSYISSS